MASSNIFDIQISNEKAFSVYKDVYGPARRQNSRGASDEDFQIVCEILEICGVKLVQIEENVNVSKMQCLTKVVRAFFPMTSCSRSCSRC